MYILSLSYTVYLLYRKSIVHTHMCTAACSTGILQLRPAERRAQKTRKAGEFKIRFMERVVSRR